MPVFLCLLFYANKVVGQSTLSNIPAINKAFELTLELKLDSATRYCKVLQASTDAQIAAWAAYLIDYQSFFKYFISENNQVAKACDADRNNALEKISKLQDTGAWPRYLKAEVYLRSSLANFKQGNYASGAQALKKAHNLLEKNIKEYPAFPYHYRSYGAVQTMLSTVPDNYKWITNSLGLKGTYADGIKNIENALNRTPITDFDKLFARETLFLFTFLQINVAQNAEAAWSMVETNTRDADKNLLSCYLRGVTALKSARNDEAIMVFKNGPSHPDFYPFVYLDYLLALAHLRKLEAEQSRSLFRKFLTHFQGVNHQKDALQKIAWSYLIEGNVNAYRFEIEKIKSTGINRLEGDKQAQIEAEKQHLPHISLLRMRLLFDGGYYNEALKTANGLNHKNLAAAQLTEFKYRRGRIFQLQKRNDEALSDYEHAIASGSELPEYFAAAAALQSGYIYLALGNKDKAKRYFELVSLCKNEEYKDSLRQKAKAALKNIP